tara:strand:+ start:1510 stop:2307 length:798 start_codon:yes stop_codon:yes gene_type:complete
VSIDNSLDASIRRLLRVMKQLRDPETGCEWDKRQDFLSISPFTIEEAYEVVDSIEREDYESLKEELGDLLLQVVFHAEIASELGLFKFEDVVNSISKKLINRHPYVFTEQRKHTQEEQLDNWEETKSKEKEKKNLDSLMDDLPRNLPALLRSQKIQKRAGKVGFDWDSEEICFKKIEEEIAELKEAINSSIKDDIKNELGDVLISVVNLAKHLKVDAEDSLRQGNLKFENRFRFIETELKKKNKSLSNTSLEEMDLLWEKAKQDL